MAQPIFLFILSNRYIIFFSFLPFLLLLLPPLFEFSYIFLSVERDITRSLLEGGNDSLIRRPNLI